MLHTAWGVIELDYAFLDSKEMQAGRFCNKQTAKKEKEKKKVHSQIKNKKKERGKINLPQSTVCGRHYVLFHV